MLLSIGMMVKNEEKHLEECLSSLMPILENINSELIIVDTGSDDRTVEIAKKYTEKVYFHKWNNNFSEMRNITISYAKGEWFFVIDGDEVLESTNEIIDFFKSGEYEKYNSASMGAKNYTSSNDKNKFGLCDTIRFFRNDGSFKYKGSVHNQPIYEQPTKKLLCNLEHYGYISDDKELMERKFIRTSNILKTELEKDPENIYYRYQLAVSYSMHEDFEESLEEITRVYSKLDKNNKKLYKYIFNEYANILLNNNKIKECEDLCTTELKLTSEDEVYKIDLRFFLAKAQSLQKNYEAAINNYKKYLELLDKWEKGKVPIDLSVKILTSSDKFIAYSDIAIMEYTNKNYKEVIKNVIQIEDENIFCNLLNILIKSIIKLKDYKWLKDIYLEIILNMSTNTIKLFENELETIKINLYNKNVNNKNVNNKIEEVFSNENIKNVYIDLNKFRTISEYEDKAELYDYLIENVNFNESVGCYGELIYFALKENYNVNKLIEKLRYDKIIEFLDYCDKKYDDLSDIMLKFVIKNNHSEDNFIKSKINVSLCKSLLILDKLNKNDDESIFEIYIESGIKLLKMMYSQYIIENEMVLELKDSEHEFFLYMMKAEENKNKARKEYIKYLRFALEAYPYMNRGIERILKEIEERNNEILELKKKFIDNIKRLIEGNDLESSKELLRQYKESFYEDFEVYSVEAVISIIEGDITNGIKLLEKALHINKSDFDCLYNLAYCYEITGEKNKAIRTYRKAWFYLTDQLEEKELLMKLYSLEYNIDDYEKVEKIYTYYNQVKEFVLKRYSGDKTVKFNDIVIDKKPKLNTKVRVLFGPIEIANQMNTYSYGLNSKDIDSYTINKFETYLNYESDFSIKGNSITELEVNKIAQLIAEFDVFHLFFGASLLDNYKDLDILKELDKKVVMNYWGSDVRIKSIAKKNNKYVKLKFEDDNLILNNLRFISKKIDTCIVPDTELYQYVKPYFKNIEFLKAGVISNEISEDVYTQDCKKDKITIVHAPTNRKVKGSDYIIDAVNNLSKIYDIDFILVENMKHEEAKEIYKKADIIIDQICIGTYGIFAIESMSIGKPVVTYIADAYRNGYPEELPLISANPDNIYSVLEERIKNIDETKLIGKQGIAYVEKYHNYKKIGESLSEIYKRLS